MNSKEATSKKNNKNEDKHGKAKRHVGQNERVQYDFPYLVDKKVYLELLVVVDIKMEEFYGEFLENHVLTLLFLVNTF